MARHPYRQCDIDRIARYRGLPTVKRQWPCFVNGELGRIWGAGGGANLLVKFAEDGRVRVCHPGWRIQIHHPNGSKVYASEDS